ncbi:ABC transporter substrate-binding protein [Candidatus Woesearchaeota archaeon]|nr:ABC transporter substrate-binding protein [Candidatus Woesearchaeota archaeon]
MKHAATILVLAILLVGCTATGNNVNEQDVITIGVISSFSGEMAVQGEHLEQGVTLAYEQLDRTALTHSYRLLFEDDAYKSDKTAAAYRKLHDIDGASAIIGSDSRSGNIVAPIAETDAILFCSVASDPAVVKGRKYVFKHWTTPEAEVASYLAVVEQQGWDRVIVLESVHPGVEAISDMIEKAARERGILLERHRFQSGDTDFRGTLAKLKNQDFDAFALFLMPNHLQTAGKQILEFGFEQPRTTIEMYDFIDDVSLFEGEWYIAPADPTGRFVASFTERYGEAPESVAPNGYDCLNLLVKAFEEGGTDPDDAMTVIRQLKDYQGAVGTLHYSGSLIEGGSIESPALKKMIVNGKRVLVE